MIAMTAILVSSLTLSTTDDASARDRIRRVESWTYQLQKVDTQDLIESDYDLVVLDYADENLIPWDRSVIERIKKRGPGKAPRVVLAYISVGEAESYRPYWRSEWSKKRPDWLGKRNPHWRENYHVKYWDKAWRELLLGFGGYIDRVLEQGFDGVYLDRIDSYTVWGPHGRGAKHADKNAPSMVEFVTAIAHHIRRVRRHADAVIVGQNAPGLVAVPGYLKLIDAVALEDILFYAGRRRAKRYTRFILDLLQPLQAAGKPVLAVDYLSNFRKRTKFARLAREAGLIPFGAPSRWLDKQP